MSAVRAVAAVALILTLTWTGASLASARPSILDFYPEIPQEFLAMTAASDGKPLTREAKLKRVVVKDLANGYLEVDTSGLDGYESKLVLALFSRNTKAALIGLAYQWGDHSNGLIFVAREAGRWRDVTGEVMPKIDDTLVNDRARSRITELTATRRKLADCASGTFRYVLPRRGTRLTAIASAATSDCLKAKREVTLMTFAYDGERFHLEP